MLFQSGSIIGGHKRAAMLGIAGLELLPTGVSTGAVCYLRLGKRAAARYAEYGTGRDDLVVQGEAGWEELLTKAAIL
ncbi:hypothetical protein MOQ72_20915 [Saccharopolyspora sp. K220]|uniref:hypothetical protein n=1 Tax=Saccharopolyspora soli TaxID=2926618 RepID=UPI001F577881|nr:hypothetical protein [Saccharopolyspora soli]MCI2419913.1 hypothetical protein [Saccharopolyspora soli]